MDNKTRRCGAALTAVLGFAALFLLFATVTVRGQQGSELPAESGAARSQVEAGKRIYHSACISCHGVDGKGARESSTVFKRPDSFPDFTRCDQTTPELDIAYKAVITYGGRFRGFSQIMPAFGEALTPEEITDLVHYVRTFCTDKRWPRGDLNLPRALVTEKAFPEDELVLSTAVNAQGAPGNTTHIIHEQRFGIHNQLEVDLPIMFQDQNHTWYGGVGDLSMGVKREMFSSLRTGSILSLQGSLIAPTGNRDRGFGSGTTTFEAFAAFDQLFRSNSFIQTQFGADLPHNTHRAPQSLFFNAALGQSFAAHHGMGRLWTPMVEFLASHSLINNGTTNWDVLPQMQVTISHRQHVAADLGVRVPVNNTAGRPIQVMMYFFWDWQDGKITEGW